MGTGVGSTSLLTKHTGLHSFWLSGVLSSLQPQMGPAVVLLGGYLLGHLFSLPWAALLLSSFSAAFLMTVSSTASALLSWDYYFRSYRFFSSEPKWFLNFFTLLLTSVGIHTWFLHFPLFLYLFYSPWYHYNSSRELWVRNLSVWFFSYLSFVIKIYQSCFSFSQIYLLFSAWAPMPIQASILFPGLLEEFLSWSLAFVFFPSSSL